MYQNTENQQKIIVGTKNIKLIRCARYGIAIGVISWIFIGYLNVGFAQTENSISAEAKQQENTTEKNNQNDNQNAGENSTLTQDNQDPNAKIRIEIITDNSTFFDPQDEKINKDFNKFALSPVKKILIGISKNNKLKKNLLYLFLFELSNKLIFARKPKAKMNDPTISSSKKKLTILLDEGLSLPIRF